MADEVRVFIDERYWCTMSREAFDAWGETNTTREAIMRDLAAAYANRVEQTF